MEKQICPACSEILMLSVSTDETVPVSVTHASAPVLTTVFWGDSPALLHCTEECGHRQKGYVRNLTICSEHGELLEGEFVAVHGD